MRTTKLDQTVRRRRLIGVFVRRRYLATHIQCVYEIYKDNAGIDTLDHQVASYIPFLAPLVSCHQMLKKVHNSRRFLFVVTITLRERFKSLAIDIFLALKQHACR